jgi:hypothetical protein
MDQCPLWVISGHERVNLRCPLYPQKRTLTGDSWISALCQKQTLRRVLDMIESVGTAVVHLNLEYT